MLSAVLLPPRCQQSARLIFLPPYSPGLNPAALALAKLKTLLRMAAGRAFDALWGRIGQLLADFTPEECASDITRDG
ncbi:hypothetical protein [Phreatobacter stygius]|uniref:Tc1-like transposase DDE domain-containing protein n=1 Tax=Phreatobacter stygius TaxID=1940610 RepID=A0A4D7B4K4_9HYPH|nr:hypothetical protein E8M01_01085 [Phreatobacter stygius]